MENLHWGSPQGEDTTTVPTKGDQKPSFIMERPSFTERVYNRLYFYSHVSTSSVLKLNRELRDISNEMLHERIVKEISEIGVFLHIHTHGGAIFAGLSAMDEVLNCVMPVTTIVDGCCASSGTFISIVGKKRLINVHAYMLIHQITSIFWGKYEEAKDHQENLDKLMQMIKGVYKEYTKLPEAKIELILKRDLWLDARQCLEYGLVDEIIGG